jgi:hypothetical protein
MKSERREHVQVTPEWAHQSGKASARFGDREHASAAITRDVAPTSDRYSSCSGSRGGGGGGGDNSGGCDGDNSGSGGGGSSSSSSGSGSSSSSRGFYMMTYPW